MRKLAIIGLGKWGKKLLTTFSTIADISTCCTTGKQENLDWLREHFPEVKHTKNFDEILNDKTIEAVIIATPIATHYELAKKVLLANKHVFVEKPPATNEKAAKELFDLAIANSRILFVGNVFLYSDVFKELEKINKTQPFEDIQWEWNKYGTFAENIFWNLAWHDILTSVVLMGKARAIQLVSHTGSLSENDIVKIRLEFLRKKTCTISIDRAASNVQKSALFTTQETQFTWTNDSLYSLTKETNEHKLIFESKIPPLTTECNTFISYLNNSTTKIEHAQFILETIRIIEALAKQAHE